MIYPNKKLGFESLDHTPFIELITKGYRVRYKSFGSGPVFLLLNPVGQKIALWAPLIMELMKSNRVIWVSDICFSGSEEFCELQYCDDDNTFFHDAIPAVLERENVERVSLLSWCAASKLSADLALNLGPRILAEIYLAPSLVGMDRYGDLNSAFETDLHKMMSMVNSNNSISSFVVEMFKKSMMQELSKANGDKAKEIIELTYAPLISEDSICSMSSRIIRFFKHDISETIAQVETPKLVIVAELDKSTSSERAVRYFSNLSASTVHEVEGADHYLPYTEAVKVSKLVGDFLRDTVGSNSWV